MAFSFIDLYTILQTSAAGWIIENEVINWYIHWDATELELYINCCNMPIQIWMASFLYKWIQLMPIQLNVLYEKMLHHKDYIWKACFFHERIQSAPSGLLCEKTLDHKDYIWMAYFFHELIQYAHLNGLWVTNIAFQGLLFFMNWFNMSIQIPF